MKYGYFDESKKEYVITRPDTPAPWVNYLGSPEYGAIVSNNAGGYSFAKSGANGRLLRYVFNQFDEPGRYIYIRDNGSKDYWSASWQPVGKDLNEYKSECHHGTAYTKMMADYSGIHSEVRYYVPLNKTYEVWNLSVTNNSDKARSLNITGYAEFTNNSNYEQDQVNLQYSQYITKTVFVENRVRQMIHANLDRIEDGKEIDNKDVVNRFIGLAGAPVDSWCGDRGEFLGEYHRYGNPVGVESGKLNNHGNYNENSCGAITTVLELAPGETKTIAFLVGMIDNETAGKIVDSYTDTKAVCDKELEELIAYWHGQLSHFQINTPSDEFNTMINTWNAYNCFMTFIWSRAASFTYCGLRNGYGYRDTVQDIQGVIHLAPEMAVEKIRFMLSAQVDNGGGLPLVKFTHNPGHEDTPDDASYVQETGHPAYRADDALWLFPTVYKYVSETGNVAFIDEVIPFANKDEGTVYEHLKRAIDFSMNHLGKHGMPAGLYADWNDCLRLGADGESTFVAFQFYYAMTILKEFAAYKKDDEYIAYLDESQEKLGKIIQELCWNEDRFIRGFTGDGQVIGKRDDPEANMWLNPQSWAVISGFASDEQADKALEMVYERLNTEYGAILMDPPYHAHAFDGALAVIYNAGTKENAGIFSQSQGWIILAEALKGHGDRAFKYFIENAPAAQNDRAEIRRLEPYCYGQFTEGKASPNFGRSHVHWLTGTASTVMVGCVEGILGMRPDFYGLHIAPSIPKAWDGFEIEKDFRGCHLHIVVKNPDHVESGCKSLLVNGQAVEGDYIPKELLSEQTEIELTM
ncbi:MAG: N,N'-diacetylchitobiose phosphorylase [Lachnospiraceae bacterium]|jgi:cellobiose phosphorylase|uniref:GH36-type glycosyl hydrolase domain-containing protein n=1 Tax=Agathobacter sp. TaxID=2021311 RepID=UPI002A5FD17C|nr:N,N'-diacetylchitobiose phosphorylase [Agathobacter sp.]MDD6353137.1 N,N'-diacetylchitobiose phosphorylase [Lachnospiraceae bacterium]MDD7206277.1 N,N'-diacetylchitobiose phosphorylase [Lachnospiraceae bacterium]MDY5863217.1 N,N'-diacetylchitobiose phosphorylase [Agathobacter sp.]